MKTMRHVIIGAVALSFASAVHTFAIEGLKIAVQSSNVVLSWPSTNGETYIVQYRPTLNTTSSWTTLTDFYPAATGTNITFFVHSNIVQYPQILDSGTNSGGGAPPAPDSMTASSSSSAATTATQPSVPMVMPVNGSGGAVPLAIYPPGFDLYGFLIYNPSTGQWMSGNGYTVPINSVNNTQAGDIQPLDDSGTNSSPDPGFYRVVRDGVHVYGLTNGMVLSGIAQFPIEIAWTNNSDQIVGVSFYDANTNPIIGAYAQSPSGNGWQMVWNTPLSFNGSYNIYAELDFASNDPVVSNPVTVTVSNVISFPNYFSQMFGNQMWIYAETITNAAYQLDMYDQNTNYLGSFTGTADGNGVISFLWNLVDGTGQVNNSTNFYGIFTVDTSSLSSPSQGAAAQSFRTGSPALQTASLVQKAFSSQALANGPYPAAGSSSANATQTWAKEPAWQVGNSWAIAWSPLIVNGSYTTLDIQQMMIGGSGGPYGGVVSTLGDYGLGASMSPGNVSQSSAFEMADAGSRTNFLSYMAQSQYRHFYFFGHGSPSAFGTPGAVITYIDVQHALHNFLDTAMPANYHPYRLVFIDGCQAGRADLCEAFGIPAQTVNTNFFASAGVESRGFLGFKNTITFNPSQWTWRSLMLGGFFGDWLLGNPLQTCVANAEAGAHSSGFQDMDSSAVIYGAVDLTVNSHTGQ